MGCVNYTRNNMTTYELVKNSKPNGRVFSSKRQILQSGQLNQTQSTQSPNCPKNESVKEDKKQTTTSQIMGNEDRQEQAFSTFPTSNIYKLAGGKKNIKSVIEEQSEIEQELQKYKKSRMNQESNGEDYELNGIINEQDGFSRINIYNSCIALQFTIPKSRAGPLVVPYIDYKSHRDC